MKVASHFSVGLAFQGSGRPVRDDRKWGRWGLRFHLVSEHQRSIVPGGTRRPFGGLPHTKVRGYSLLVPDGTLEHYRIEKSDVPLRENDRLPINRRSLSPKAAARARGSCRNWAKAVSFPFRWSPSASRKLANRVLLGEEKSFGSCSATRCTGLANSHAGSVCGLFSFSFLFPDQRCSSPPPS